MEPKTIQKPAIWLCLVVFALLSQSGFADTLFEDWGAYYQRSIRTTAKNIPEESAWAGMCVTASKTNQADGAVLFFTRSFDALSGARGGAILYSWAGKNDFSYSLAPADVTRMRDRILHHYQRYTSSFSLVADDGSTTLSTFTSGAFKPMQTFFRIKKSCATQQWLWVVTTRCRAAEGCPLPSQETGGTFQVPNGGSIAFCYFDKLIGNVRASQQLGGTLR